MPTVTGVPAATLSTSVSQKRPCMRCTSRATSRLRITSVPSAETLTKNANETASV